MTRAWSFNLIADDGGYQAFDETVIVPYFCEEELRELIEGNLIKHGGVSLGYHDLDRLEITLDKPHQPKKNGWIKVKIRVSDNQFEWKIKGLGISWGELTPVTNKWIQWNILPLENGLKEKIWMRFRSGN
jgi:hypothetical protein